MTKKAMKGAFLARQLETQASDSTGFRTSLRQFIMHLDESQAAYDKIAVDDPGTKCLFITSMVKWAHLANFRLLKYLEKINKGECDEVLALDYAKLCNKTYWLRGRKKSDMMAYSDKPLKAYLEFWNSDETSWDIYQLYESIVCELADNLKKVKSTFERPELYEKFMQQMKVQYADPDIDYEYEQMKEAYVEPSTNDYLKMQVKACVEFLKSGMLNNVLSISNDDIDKVDEEKLRKLLDPDYKTPDNLKKLWAKLKKFIELKENVLLVPKRGLIRMQVLKHFNELNGEHFSALFRLEKLLTLMHQDMVKMKPELVKYLNGAKNEQITTVQHHPDEEMFHFIHPSLDDEEGWKIHNEVKRLVKRQSIPDICQYLGKLASENKILLPQMSSVAYTELVRMGMPNTGGFSKEHFRKQYHQ